MGMYGGIEKRNGVQVGRVGRALCQEGLDRLFYLVQSLESRRQSGKQYNEHNYTLASSLSELKSESPSHSDWASISC